MTDSPHPVLQALTGADLARLRQLAGFLERARAAVRYVDYRQAESDCAALAEKLLTVFSASELAAMHFEEGLKRNKSARQGQPLGR